MSTRPTILIVDDTPDNIMLLSQLLKDRYNTRVANSGTAALQAAHSGPVDLVLLDVMMPGVDGYETCRRFKADPATAHIPVIFLTAKNQVEDEARGLQLGAVDYLSKPISPPVLFARVATQLTLKRQREQLESAMQDGIILAMASMAETRDNETGNHIRRTQNYVRALALELRGHPRFSAELTDDTIELLYKSAPLHDIGKVGIPDRILLKPGRLDSDEFEVMKLHTVYGRDMIMQVQRHAGGPDGFLRLAREIAYAHQEKWDGSGYPENLAGEAIPLSARLMAVADVYDALISRRVYKPAFPHSEALTIMRKGRGTHFDPDILDAFLRIEARFAAIAAEFRDADDPLPQ
jgi:putative two-component system response regulator